jgi:hypothetical protein
MAKLNANGRKKIAKKNFALPGKKAYPIHDRAHGANALARVSQHGTPAEKKAVRSKVCNKYPSMTSCKSSKPPKKSR